MYRHSKTSRGHAMQNPERSPSTAGQSAVDGPQPPRRRGRREAPWAVYAIKGSLVTLAVIATVGLGFAVASGVLGSAIAAAVALIALAAVVRPVWRALDATYEQRVEGEPTSRGTPVR
jgi:hypothetical protein